MSSLLFLLLKFSLLSLLFLFLFRLFSPTSSLFPVLSPYYDSHLFLFYFSLSFVHLFSRFLTLFPSLLFSYPVSSRLFFCLLLSSPCSPLILSHLFSYLLNFYYLLPSHFTLSLLLSSHLLSSYLLAFPFSSLPLCPFLCVQFSLCLFLPVKRVHNRK